MILCTFRLYCDVPACLRRFPEDGGMLSSMTTWAEARKEAKAMGWVRRSTGFGMGDFCPLHAKGEIR